LLKKAGTRVRKAGTGLETTKKSRMSYKKYNISKNVFVNGYFSEKNLSRVQFQFNIFCSNWT